MKTADTCQDTNQSENRTKNQYLRIQIRKDPGWFSCVRGITFNYQQARRADLRLFKPSNSSSRVKKQSSMPVSEIFHNA